MVYICVSYVCIYRCKYKVPTTNTQNVLHWLLDYATTHIFQMIQLYATSGYDMDDVLMYYTLYLYEYCDMKKELEKVSLENEEILEAGYFPDMSVFDEAEANILERIDEYPKVWPWHLDKYARIIQKGCHNWLWKPITADGKHGINLRIGLNALEKEKNL